MFDPRLALLFGIILIGVGIFNIVRGRRSMLRAQTQGQMVVWYKHATILTGVEYLLLAAAFLLSASISLNWFPPSLDSLVIPAYLIILLTSGGLAGYVIYQGIVTSRKARRNREKQASRETRTVTIEQAPLTPEQMAEQARKRRERRQKAAAARRRRAGKA